MTTVGPAPRRHPLFRAYYLLTVAGAAAYLALGRASAGSPPWAALAITLVLMWLADLVPVRLPGGGFVTPGAALDFAALFVFGPAWTAALSVLATVLGQGVVLRRPAERVAF